MAENDDKPGEKPEDLEIVETDAEGKPIAAAPDDEEDQDGDQRLANEAETVEGKAERKRETHQERRERWRRARERDQREMNYLRSELQRLNSQVHNLTKTTVKTQAETIDQRLIDAANEVATAESIIAAAIKAGNGEDVVKAQRLRDEAQKRVEQLQTHRKSLEAPATPPVPRVPPYAGFARDFAKDKPWFTWDRSDPDSRAILEIDGQVAREGYDPNTEGYWKELNRRVKQKLPHRFNGQKPTDDLDDFEDGDDGEESRQSQRKGPPLGSGRSSATPRKHEAYISPERKQAMIDAGVWDDPVLRRKYAKAYAEWDRNNQAARR